jgi:hypothetical protein
MQHCDPSPAKSRGVRRSFRHAMQALALSAAGVLTVATAGEVNDEESQPGGLDPGGEHDIGDEEVDFSEVETPTEVVV